MTRAQIIFNEIHLKTCGKLTGAEEDNEILDKFFSPQGIEYCTETSLPTMELFEMFDDQESQKEGLYINEKVRLANYPRIALVGKEAHGKLRFDRLEGFTVILLHGATAEIEATDYAVVNLIDPGHGAKVTVKDKAKVL